MCDCSKLVVAARPAIWQWLSEIANVPVDAEPDLRTQAIWSSHAALAYGYHEAFERLERLPLKLTQGDPRQNLDELADVDYASLSDKFSKSMRACIELGVSLAVLADVLLLSRETPCATNLVEQGHGSGAATLKAHSQFGVRSLQVRTAIHQCRALFSQPPGRSRLRH